MSEPDETTEPPPIPVVTGVRNFVYITLAALFFLLGMIGVVLPGIPTTPFLLLMSYFLVRVSPRLNQKVLSWPVVGKPLREWEEKRAVDRKVKWLAYAMVVVFASLTIFFSSLAIPLKIVIGLAAMIGMYVVYRLPVLK